MKTLIRLVILALLLAAAWLIREQLAAGSHTRFEERQWVKLVDEPPPPPPQEEPRPEPEPLQEISEPEALQEAVEEPQEAEQQTDDQLGVDEEGRAGSDSFGLRAKKGGKDLLKTAPAGDGSGNRGGIPASRGPLFLAYGGAVTNDLERFLMNDPKLRERAFKTVLKLWIDPSGKIERCEIDQSSGSRETDERLVSLVSGFKGRFAAPPQGMPQPVKIRIRSTQPSGLSFLDGPPRSLGGSTRAGMPPRMWRGDRHAESLDHGKSS